MRAAVTPAFVLSVLLYLPASPGCKKAEEHEQVPKGEEATEPVEGAKKSAAQHKSESGIVWIDNDYTSARTQAQAENKPLVIDMWAAWCHTCLAMQEGVLSDRGLASVASDYVWLAVDTEAPSSAGVMAKFPPKVWPTFFVVSPEDESVQASQLGACSVADFREFLGRGSRGHLAQLEAEGQLTEDSPLFHLRAGDRAWMQERHAAAAAHYGRALEIGGPAWEHRPATLKNQISALSKLEDMKACAELASSQLENIEKDRSTASTDFMYYASTCAKALPEESAAALRSRSLQALDRILSSPKASLSYDDRSDALANSRALAVDLGQKERALAYARAQQALLEKAITEAQTPIEEMTYVWHRAEVHVFLQEGDKVLAWIESLEKRLPEEYDPPYRKGWVLLQLGRHAEAHRATRAALSLARGARRGRILGLDAAIYKAEGNRAKEREVREATLAHYEGLPPGQRSERGLKRARMALEAMNTSPAR